MKKEIYKAAARGDVVFLKEAKAKDVEAAAAVYSDDDLLGLTSQGNNIIHVAAQFGHLDFIKTALECFPSPADQRKLICEANSGGDTPLHLAAKQRTKALAKCLIIAYHLLPGSPPSPWRIKNNRGNTPLHLALMNGGKSIQVAAYLLRVGPEVAAYANHLKQTPLHLAVIYDTQGTEISTIQIINLLNSQQAALSTRNSLFGQEKEDISLILVRSLLEKNSEVCCLCDADGMTPLLRAAVRSNLPVVDAIVNECPESIEICDPKGKNMLHYIRFPTSLEARRFLEKPEIPVELIDQQDHDGNTPIHIAVMNHDFGMEKENEKEVIKDGLMSGDFYRAVGNGKWDTLREIMLNDEKQFLSRLVDGSNVIHLAIQGLQQYKFVEHSPDDEPFQEEQFIVDALKKYPVLFYQTNHLGETPLHLDLFHQMWQIRVRTQIYSMINEELMNLKGQGELPLPLPLPPWKVKDVQGNTILHLAVKYGNIEFAEYLLRLDANLAGEANHSKQTPLHLLCQPEFDWGFFRNISSQQKMVTKWLIEEDASAVYSRDVEGFTPLLRAAQTSIKGIAMEILEQHPQSIRQIDSHAQNFFHHFNIENEETRKELCEKVAQKEMEILITQKDDQGNTPFDLAVEKGDFGKARCLIECSGELKWPGLYRWLLQHKDSTIDKIERDKKCRSFQNFLKARGGNIIFDDLMLDRSTYGVRREDIKEYMNTMGVVAALLATVTFTAAFTVPGGYKGDTGIPNLGKEAAFKVFMFADALGMCSSMMVLFCLLWLLSNQDTEDDVFKEDEKQVFLVDMTIKLLLISFYATLVAFMTGVYVHQISQNRWLAIFTCVLCSFLILLMRRPHIKYLSIIFRILPLLMCYVLPDYFKENKSISQPQSHATSHNRDQQ